MLRPHHCYAPRVTATQVPTTLPTNADGVALAAPLDVAGKTWSITCVSMGNPHAIIFVDDLDDIELAQIGPLFERHAVFPARTNTEFVQVCACVAAVLRIYEVWPFSD